MAAEDKRTDPNAQGPGAAPEAPVYVVRLPGFLVGEPVGLGDVIKRTSAALGFAPCSGCDRRAAALNRRFVLAPKKLRGR